MSDLYSTHDDRKLRAAGFREVKPKVWRRDGGPNLTRDQALRLAEREGPRVDLDQQEGGD